MHLETFSRVLHTYKNIVTYNDNLIKLETRKMPQNDDKNFILPV